MPGRSAIAARRSAKPSASLVEGALVGRRHLADSCILVRDCTSFGMPDDFCVAARAPVENDALIAALLCHHTFINMSDSESDRTDPLAPPERRSPTARRKAPVPKRKKPGPYRVPPRSQRHGLVIVNTGNGKGKTTAALGLLLRASGRGMRAGMFQFVKSLTNGGEHRAAERLGVEIVSLGDGCTIESADTADASALAQAGWARVRDLIAAGEYDVLILDELTLPIKWGWVDDAEVISALGARPAGTHVVITGRHASQELIDAADLVTDMTVIKHPLREQNIRAQAGVDV